MLGTNLNTGLSYKEAASRTEEGLSNSGFTAKTKSISRILFENIFTLFNLLNIILAAMVISVGSFRNALFMLVVICNTAIGIYQEISAKRAIDKLSILSQPKADVIRGGVRKTIPADDVVIGDIMLLYAGMQVCADGVVREGNCEANESLITGESDEIYKTTDSELFSGSYVTAGFVKAEVTRVGAQSMAGRITSAKYFKKPSSDMMNAINKIIRVLSIIIVPFGVIMMLKSLLILETPFEFCVTSTVAALIGMIPEGLVLLTGIALAVSVIRLAKQHALCRDLYCVEQLARTDVLCIDKTGTLTEGRLKLSEIIPIDDRFDVETAIAGFVGAFPEQNSTLKAIAEQIPQRDATVERTIPFSSARKYSAAQIEGVGTLVLGALEFIPAKDISKAAQKCEGLYSDGYRIVVLAHSFKPLDNNSLPDDLAIKAIICLSDVIRPTAAKTLDFFKSQGVAVKIISGDALPAVVNIAKRVNLDDAENAVDMSQVPDELIPEICEKYSVFCRTSPDQKLLLVKSLKAAGHKTAMTGDGVNDVLALRESDCSIAIGSGSDAARTVSQIVLMNSDFSSVPLIVGEGRRCINNIQTAAALFLFKTVFSVILTTIYLFIPLNYPFMPIQFTLISAFAIGIPSFFLAMEPNTNPIKGSFLKNTMVKALPGGISAVVGVVALNVLDVIFSFSNQELSTMAVCVTAAAFFGALFNICKPFNRRKAVMFAVVLALFSIAAICLSGLFYLCRISAESTIMMAAVMAGTLVVQIVLRKFLGKR